MKSFSLILIFLCGCVFSAEKLTLTKDGQTAYRIVLPENAAPVLHTAAKELSEHLNRITGAAFPIVDEKDHREGPAFFIGPVTASKAVFVDAEFSNTKPDTTVVSFRGKDVFLSGAPSSGPLYAVYTFLEEYCGVRWWSLGETDIPNEPNLTIEKREYSYAPKLISREACYRNSRPCVQAARTKSNGHFSLLKPEYGDHRYIIGQVHTFGQFLPPSKYYSEHQIIHAAHES